MIIEQGKLCEVEKEGLNKEVIILNRKLDLKDTSISILNRRVLLKDQIVEFHLRNEEIYNVENKALREKINTNSNSYIKAIKIEKRKTLLFKITTVVAIIGGGYLVLK